MNEKQEAIELYRKMGLMEHTVVWNNKFSEDKHVKIIDMGYGLGKIFHPRNVEVYVCNFCVYSDMKDECPKHLESKQGKKINRNFQNRT